MLPKKKKKKDHRSLIALPRSNEIPFASRKFREEEEEGGKPVRQNYVTALRGIYFFTGLRG